jgi:hypothetical protein
LVPFPKIGGMQNEAIVGVEYPAAFVEGIGSDPIRFRACRRNQQEQPQAVTRQNCMPSAGTARRVAPTRSEMMSGFFFPPPSCLSALVFFLYPVGWSRPHAHEGIAGRLAFRTPPLSMRYIEVGTAVIRRWRLRIWHDRVWSHAEKAILLRNGRLIGTLNAIRLVAQRIVFILM